MTDATPKKRGGSIARRLNDLSLKKKIVAWLIIMLSVFVLSSLTALILMQFTLACRDYVVLEKTYSTHQRVAVHALENYLQYQKKVDYSRFVTFMQAPLAITKAHFELKKQNINFDTAYQSLIEAYSHPAAAKRMAYLYLIFRSAKLSPLKQTRAIWTAADLLIVKLEALGKEVYAIISKSKAADGDVRAVGKKLARLNDKLSSYEKQFSSNLGAAARQAEKTVQILLLIMTVICIVTGTVYGYYIVQDMTHKKACIIAGIDKIAERDYTARIELANQDEFGLIAAAFNQMSAMILKNNVKLTEEIDERKKTEKNLCEVNLEMEALVSGIPSILIGISDSQTVTQWNAAAAKILRIQSSDVLGKPFSECGLDWDWEQINQGITLCRKKVQPLRLEDIHFTRADGKKRFLGVTLNPFAGDEKLSVNVLLVGADITEKKNLKGQLAQAQKLESIGQLAAGIAHEINTPIQYVGDNTRFLQEAFASLFDVLKGYDQLLTAIKQGLPTDTLVQEVEGRAKDMEIDYLEEEMPTAILQTLDGVERVSKIIRSMKEFSHPGGKDKTAVNINNALKTTITVAKNEWKYVSEIETDFDQSLPLLFCLPGELNQVFLNMIINASHAIAEVVGNTKNKKGKIRIGTRRLEDKVEIRFSDTGGGIPENIRHRIFDPFFTTKAVGKGTGQGLAISHSVIVKKHRGSLTFESKDGKGTTFIIQLPLDGKQEQEEEKNEKTDTIRG